MEGNCKMEAFDNPDVIENNNSIVKLFIQKLEKERKNFRILYPNTTKQREHRVCSITIDEAVDFLLDFQFANVAEAVRRDNTVRYIKYLAAWPGCKIDHVDFMQMAYDGITIQLYNFELSPCYPNRPTAYTISINYPDKLSTAYCTNNQEVMDVDVLFNEVEEEYE